MSFGSTIVEACNNFFVCYEIKLQNYPSTFSLFRLSYLMSPTTPFLLFAWNTSLVGVRSSFSCPPIPLHNPPSPLSSVQSCYVSYAMLRLPMPTKKY